MHEFSHSNLLSCVQTLQDKVSISLQTKLRHLDSGETRDDLTCVCTRPCRKNFQLCSYSTSTPPPSPLSLSTPPPLLPDVNSLNLPEVLWFWCLCSAAPASRCYWFWTVDVRCLPRHTHTRAHTHAAAVELPKWTATRAVLSSLPFTAPFFYRFVQRTARRFFLSWCRACCDVLRMLAKSMKPESWIPFYFRLCECCAFLDRRETAECRLLAAGKPRI